MINRSANPTLNENTFANVPSHGSGHMTLDGTVNKTFIMLLLVMLTSFYTWNLFLEGNPLWQTLRWVGLLGGLAVAIILVFKNTFAPVLAPAYALLEGLFIGGISAYFESLFPGIVLQAVALTFGTLFALLLAYKSKMIQATENFKLMVVSATVGIMIVYVISLVLRLFGTQIPFIHESGLIGIGFSLFVVVIAALNLVLDFDFIEKAAERKAPGYMEWYGAFGLMVTLIWLYIEFLHLLAKLRSR